MEHQSRFRPRRRTVIAAAATAPLARFLAAGAASSSQSGMSSVASSYRFLTAHQAAVVIEATARLVPGPQDDPAEAGHPGAREAGVVHFVDRLLAGFEDTPPHIFAGGPWSNRHAAGPDRMARFVPLHERQRLAWRDRISRLRKDVAAAIDALDRAARAAGYDSFVSAPKPEQDRILTEQAEARDVLFTLTIDAMYSVPEYGGNRGLSAWHEIKWPGDMQPVGYTKAAVESDDGVDPVVASDAQVVHELIAALPLLARARASKRARRG